MPLPPGIHVLGNNKGGHVRAYFLESDGTLIDTLSEDTASTLFEGLRAIGKTHHDIKRIVITHAHASHIKGAFAIQYLTGAPVYAHEFEARIIDGHTEAERVSFPRWSQRPRHPIVWALQIGLHFGRGKHKTCKVDGTLKDGDTIGPLEVIHTPGHTQGSLSFWHPEHKVLFAADTICTWPAPPGPWEGFTTNIDDYWRSIGKLADLGATEWLVSGHGDPVDGAHDLIRAMKR